MTTDSQTNPVDIKKPRMGRVFLDFGYYVDLDNAEMVEVAKLALWEDVMNAFKYGETHLYVETTEEPNATYDDISDFLLGEPEDDT